MMTIREEKVLWKNDVLVGEGLWHREEGDAGVVICHPHPQMGGSMYNNVVETVQEVFSSAGYSTLRFNFRGVGQSTGYYDEGRAEKRDILSACEFLTGKGVKRITLAGYSFGAWVSCRFLKEYENAVGPVILISPPQRYFDFDWTGLENKISLMICGDSDDFVDAKELEKTAKSLNAKYELLPGTDHFYGGREERLAHCLKLNLFEKKA